MGWLIILATVCLPAIARAQSAQPVSLISVLVLYTPQAAAGAGGTTALLNQINTAVVEANTVFQNSEVNARIYLADVANIKYTESGSVSNDLARLRNPNDPVFKAAHLLRTQTSADLVCLITETGSDYDFYGLQGPSAENAFSILRQPFLVGLNYLPVTLSFNFGCQLESPYADSAAAFPYASGYSFWGDNDIEYSTVEAFSGVRLPYFSNPDLQFDGHALGIPVGEPDPSDDALVLNQTAPLVAAFAGPPRLAIPPEITITYPTTNGVFYSGTNLPLTATTAAVGAKVTSVAWYDDDTNLIASAGSAPFSALWQNLPIGVHILTAVVTDTQNATTVSAPATITVLPGNDNFASRWTIPKLPATFAEPNNLATAEPGEPDNNGNPPLHSLWWTWTAPTSTYVAITIPTNHIPLNLSVYTGTNLTDLTAVAASTYWADGNSHFFFRATAGTAYQITADGQNGNWGNVAFTLTPVAGPANDDFAHRTRLTGNSITVNANNLYATHEPGEPENGNAEGNASLWYTWTAPADGQITLTSINQLGTLPVGFYTGDGLTNLTPVLCETGGNQELYGNGASLVFDVQAGVTYQIAFDNDLYYINLPGPFTFNLGFIAIPPNDNFANRTVISGSWISLTNNSQLATLEPGEPGDGSGNPSLWWSWTAPASGWVTATSATYDNLEIFTGDVLTNLVAVAAGSPDETFPVTQGITYAIAADGPAGEDALNLVLSTVQIISPANGASFYLGQTIPLAVSTTPSDGTIRQIQYVANGLAIGENAHSRASWRPSAAGLYSLTATTTDTLGHQRSSPPVTINVAYPPPSNDNFANRARLQGTWLTTTASNLGATSEPGEPVIDPNYTNSIWWQWTAPVSGLVTVVSDTWAILGVFTGNHLASLSMVTNGYYLTFAVTAGTTYDIGAVGPSGQVDLKLSESDLRITNPTNGEVFTNGSTLTLQALPTATEEPVQQIQFFAGYMYLGSVSNAPWSFAWTNVPGGNYQLRAVAYDRLGHDRAAPEVNFSLQPVNDAFASRSVLSGVNLIVTNSSAYAAPEPGDPPFFNFPPFVENQTNGVLWWQWTAPASGWTSLSVQNFGYYFLPYLGVYTGNSLANLQTIVTGYSSTGFVAVAGTTYDIGVAVEVGPVILRLIQSNVRIVSPTAGTFAPGTNLLFSVDASSVANPVTGVIFFTNSSFQAVVSSPPYTVSWTNVPAGNYTLTAEAVDNQGLTWPAQPVVVNVEPPNDNFSNRITFFGASDSVMGTVAGASFEPGEPGQVFGGEDETVWYSWTAPVDGICYFNLADDNGNGVFSVYTGSSLSNLDLVVGGGGYPFYPVKMNAVAGVTYQIQVDSLYNDDFTLELQSAPLNDNFTNATPLVGTNVTVHGDNTLATMEPGEPNSWYAIGHSVWYAWTAPAAGGVTLTLGPNDSRFSGAVYTGDSLTNLTSVDNLFPGPGYFMVSPGTTYWIAVEDGPGPYSLNLNFIALPSNDFFANRTLLSGLNFTVTGSTFFATFEPGELNYDTIFRVNQFSYPIDGGSVWYSWTAPASGYVRVQPPQAYLAVFTGNDVTNLTPVVDGQSPNEIDFATLAGQTYQFAVVPGNPWNPGPFAWSLAMDKVEIINPVAGAVFPAGTNVEVDTSTLDLDGAVTAVAFYANTNLLGIATNPPFSLIISNVPAGDDVLTAQATDAFGGVTTSQPVEIRVAPTNDNFAQRLTLSGTNITFTGDNSGATTEPGETLPGGATGRTLWWSWTAPASGTVTIINSILSGFQNATNAGFPIWCYPLVYNSKPKDVIVINPFPPGPPGSINGPLVSIYTGTSLAGLTPWAGNGTNFFGEWYVQPAFTFPVVGGQTYQISLDGINGSYGAATINWEFYPSPPPLPAPPNDNFAQRTILTGGNITTNGTTVGATLELTDPDVAYDLDARTVWYSWTAPASGTVEVEAYPGSEQSYLLFGVYAGSTPGGLIQVTSGLPFYSIGWENSVCGNSFYALAGTTYQIEVVDPGENEEPFTLTLTAPTPPILSPAPPKRLANGSYDLHVIGSVGQSFVLQSSLNGTTWTTIDTDTLLAASLDYIDTTPIGHPARAYRLLSLDTADNTQPFKLLAPNSNPANGFTLNLSGVSGTPFLIQTSTNLVDWYNLTSGVLIDNAFNYTDYAAPTYPQRFYRTVPQ